MIMIIMIISIIIIIIIITMIIMIMINVIIDEREMNENDSSNLKIGLAHSLMIWPATT